MIFPVLVIYNIHLEESECYNSFLSKIPVRQFMVYDNSPHGYQQIMDTIPAHAVYVRDENNGGLSIAYNTAAKYATEHGYERILLLDQDTKFPVEMYDEMLASTSNVCAPRVRLKNGTPFSPSAWKYGVVRGVERAPGIYPLSDYLLINSGLCVSTDLFCSVGGYNEKVRLDFADFQFMYRVRKKTHTLQLLNAVAVQDFSNEETDVKRLYSRYQKFLEGAGSVQVESFKERMRIIWLVFLHTLALTKRTKSMCFVKLWLHR